VDCAALEAAESSGIRLAGEAFLECRGEDIVGFGCGGLGEQGGRGVEFEVVGVAEDLFDRTILDGVDKSGTVAEARAEGGVGEVGAGFGEVGDGEALGHRGGAEALDLGEDEPHPVGALLAGGELGVGLLVGGGLGVEESLEVEGIGSWQGRLLVSCGVSGVGSFRCLRWLDALMAAACSEE